MESFEYDDISINVWDIGGQAKIRQLWRHYFSGTDGVIYVIDGSDSDRFEESRKELNKLLSEKELNRVDFMIFVNKKDEAINSNIEALMKELKELNESSKTRRLLVETISAKTGDGLQASFAKFGDVLGNRYSF